jgi:hypothetical protein
MNSVDNLKALIAGIQQAINSVAVPKTLTESKKEIFKGGACAVIHSVNRVLFNFQKGGMNTFSSAKPVIPGIYKVRGFWIGKPESTAVVNVVSHAGELRSNLNLCTSDIDHAGWLPIAEHCDRFEWMLVEAAETVEVPHEVL